MAARRPAASVSPAPRPLSREAARLLSRRGRAESVLTCIARAPFPPPPTSRLDVVDWPAASVEPPPSAVLPRVAR